MPKGDQNSLGTGHSQHTDATPCHNKPDIDANEKLNRFISRYSDHLRPFFAALKGAPSKGWEPECDKTFRAIKEYVASPLLLSQPVSREDLYLYMASSAMAMSAAL